MSKERAKRPSFGTLLPGDVLVNVTSEKDVFMVLRVGQRLDFYHMIDGRHLPSRVVASEKIMPQYDVVRGDSVIIASDGGSDLS